MTEANIEIFEDTKFRVLHNKELMMLTERSIRGTKVYKEGFFSKKKLSCCQSEIKFMESLTMIPAYESAQKGWKTAVLNFANPVEPGGGVLRGVNAQEEYLCRASNLYFCLISNQASSYYNYHNEILKKNDSRELFLATDNIIYSPGITFFREDTGYFPDCIDCKTKQVYTDNWKYIDVITCAAPFFANKNFSLPNGDLMHLFTQRIKQIFEVAIDNDIQSLILGAFGCGAFHNSPYIVADAFRTVLLEERYRFAFPKVVFAIKRQNDRFFCENIEAFETRFSQFPSDYCLSSERNKRRFFE